MGITTKIQNSLGSIASSIADSVASWGRTPRGNAETDPATYASKQQAIDDGLGHLVALYPQHLSSGLSAAHLAQIMRSADEGYIVDLETTLQEISSKDAVIRGLLGSRIGSAAKLKYFVRMKGTDREHPQAQEIRAYSRDLLRDLSIYRREIPTISQPEGYRLEPSFDAVVRFFAGYFWYGFSVGYLHFDQSEVYPRPVAIEPIDHRRFRVDLATDSLLLQTSANYSGEPLGTLGRAHTIQIRNDELSQPLTQCAVGRACLYPWWLSFNSWKNLTFYEDLYSVPSPVIEMGSASGFDSATVNRLLKYVRDYVSGTGTVLPPGMKASILSAQQGGEKLFDFISKDMRRRIQFAILGQTGTAEGEGGSLAKAVVNEKTRRDLVDSDGKAICSALRQIVQQGVFFRFGAGAPVPIVESFDPTDEAFIKQQETSIDLLLSEAI